MFTLAKAPVSWKSTLRSTVALSTTEAEYMAITEAVKEAIWLQGASCLLVCLILFPSVGITVVQHCSTVGIHRSFPQGVVYFC